MRMYDIIRKKRDGEELTDEEIAFFVEGYTRGEIPDYQASALCMAIWFRGMSMRETVCLTDCMAHSGDTVDLSRFGDLSVDKHSTGGVGDKTSLIVAPIVAALGGKVTKMSGRGLGHTGGTVDKLESIPGYRTALEREEFLEQVGKVGMAVIGQTGNLTPADKKLYALRDVTATVDSIPLITASIMSKKLAAGSKNIVLDVKVGSGAFMKTPEDAATLAENMVQIGKNCGRNIAAVLTNMDVPLGRAIGNALEVIEAAEVLRCNEESDLRTVCVALATEMVVLLKGIHPEEAQKQVEDTLASGAAFAKMKEWIAAQGGNARYLDDPSLFPKAAQEIGVPSPVDGYLEAMDAEAFGTASVILGGGRAAKGDEIDHAAGIILCKKPGEAVKKGEPLFVLHTNRPEVVEAAAQRCLAAMTFGSRKPAEQTLVYRIVR